MAKISKNNIDFNWLHNLINSIVLTNNLTTDFQKLTVDL